MNPKNILYLIDTCGPGGAEVIFYSLVKNIQKKGYNPIIILPDAGWLFKKFQGSGIETHVVKSSGSFNIRFLLYLINFIKKNKIDLVHAHLFGVTLYGAIAARIAGVPVLSTIHGFVDLQDSSKFFRAKRLMVVLLVRYIVFVSEALARDVLPSSKLYTKKKKVIYNGVEFSSRPLEERNYSYKVNTVIGCLGNIRPAKDYETLLNIAAEMKKREKNVTFKVYGDKENDYYQTLQSKVARMGLNEIVHFIGFATDNVEALDSMDIFLLTSKSEGFSLATVEAMSRCLPIVASRCGGPEEIITNKYDGILVDSEDVKEFSNALTQLIENPERRKKLAVQAAATVKSRFSIENMLNQYIELYDEI